MPFLILLHPDGTTTSFPVKDGLSLGARKDNDISVPLKGISRRHAEVTAAATGGFQIQDLNSTNFVFVNAEQVKQRKLVDGDTISLGGYALLLYLDNLDDVRVHEWVEEQSKPIDARADSLDQTTRIYHKDLPKSVRELEALIEVGAQLARIADTDHVLNEILEKVLKLMQADRGFIMLLNEDRQLYPAFAKNMEEDELMQTDGLSYSNSFAQKVIEQEKTLVSTNVAEDPRFQSESIISQRILSIMCAPLSCADKLLGCLYIDVRESVRYYNDSDAAFLSALANQAAIAIDNSRLTADLRKNQEFLERTNEQLQESLQTVIDTNRKLDRKIGEITALYEASRNLNTAPDVESVLRQILEQSRNVVDCERASLMMYDRRQGGYTTRLVTGSQPLLRDPVLLKPGEGIAGLAVATRKGQIANAGAEDPRFKTDRERDKATRSIMSVPLISGDKAFGIINLVNASDGTFTDDDLRLISSLANLASASVEKFNLLQAKLQQEKLNQEIEDAQKVQELLLPRGPPESEHFAFSAKYTLANRVGGDYYDFFTLPDGRIALIIADVSGHDIASALVMAMGRNLIRILFETMSTPAEVLAKTSQVLRRDTQAARYITMFLAILDPQAMKMTYSNAGHNYPLFLRKGAAKFENLETGGFPLGLVDDFNYMEETVDLNPGDQLILYTDGVTEAQAPSGDMFELERLEALLLAHRDEPLDAITQKIYGTVTDFVGSAQFQDDFTFVSMRVKAAARRKGGVFDVSFPSRQDLVANYGARMASFLTGQGYATRRGDKLGQVLNAALSSAVVQGNQEDPGKLVYVKITPGDAAATVSIRSEALDGPAPTFEQGTLELLRTCATSIRRSQSGDELLITFERDGAAS